MAWGDFKKRKITSVLFYKKLIEQIALWEGSLLLVASHFRLWNIRSLLMSLKSLMLVTILQRANNHKYHVIVMEILM